MRLQDCLEGLTPKERATLRERRGIVIDPNKRIDEVEQMARALVTETDLRKTRFPTDTRLLLQRFVQLRGTIADGASEPGAQQLIELGIAYPARDTSKSGPSRSGKRLALGALVLPSCFLVQLPLVEGEDVRSLRALLSRTEHEIINPMLQTVLGKPLVISGPLALQEIWEALQRPGEIAARIAALPSAEARLLDGIERGGGEANTQELLALDQTPGVVRSSSTIAIPKRGAPYMLQRRAMLFAVGIDRFVLPTEVVAVVGATRAKERAERRTHVLGSLQSEDFAPSKARMARDPGAVIVAALAMMRAWDLPIKDDVAVSRTVLRRCGERLGESDESMALLIALARASLGRLSVPGASLGPTHNHQCIVDVAAFLRDSFRRGGAWDETRTEPETLRAAQSDGLSSAGALLRNMLFDALESIAKDLWVPVDLLTRYVMEDPRVLGAKKIHERARRERAGLYVERLEDALNKMLVDSLPDLGLADVSEDRTVIRYRPKARVSIDLTAQPRLTRTTLELPNATSLQAIAKLAEFAEPEHIRADSGAIAFNVGANAIARARARELTSDDVSARLEAAGVEPPFEGVLREMLDSLEVDRELSIYPISAAIHVEDAELLRVLQSDPTLRRWIVSAQAGEWLFIKAEVDLTRVQARLQRLGVRAKLTVATSLQSEHPAIKTG
jgi:hypothetical protein